MNKNQKIIAKEILNTDCSISLISKRHGIAAPNARIYLHVYCRMQDPEIYLNGCRPRPKPKFWDKDRAWPIKLNSKGNFYSSSWHPKGHWLPTAKYLRAHYE